MVYECASALVALSSSITAIRAAANSYTQLLSNQSDNNIKLIVLERIIDLKRHHPKVVSEFIMDVLRALATSNLDIRRKTLDITLDLVTSSTIGEIMLVLKKEVVKTATEDGEKSADYRALLIASIHKCVTQFPDAVTAVVPVLMDFLGDANQASAVDVILFVREIVQTYPHLREAIMRKLLATFSSINSSRVARVALWLVGEYCTEASDVALAFSTIKSCVGDLPFVPDEGVCASGVGNVLKEEDTALSRGGGRPLVLADGSYASQSAVESEAAAVAATTAGSGAVDDTRNLRGILATGDYFLATVVASSLVKLALRSRLLLLPSHANMVAADAMLLMTGLLQLGSAKAAPGLDADSRERILIYLQVLSQSNAELSQLCLNECRDSFSAMLIERMAAHQISDTIKGDSALEVNRQADDLIMVRQLRGKGEAYGVDLDDDEELGLSKATGAVDIEDFASRLKRVTQLTGLSDAVYAEAYVMVHAYDIKLDLLVINRTPEPMHNLSLELATVGDLKLCERPQAYTMAPGESKRVKANIKVSSTETGIIFGCIVYDAPHASSGASERTCVVLNDIHIDIMDYIAPASCTDLAFRAMWAEFEWENKVAVNTDLTEVGAFLRHVVASTHMKCLTPQSALEGESGFLAANLYAKSIFGEDALVNVSVEQRTDGNICGFIRIRSKTQGIALSLGDKITLKQRTSR